MSFAIQVLELQGLKPVLDLCAGQDDAQCRSFNLFLNGYMQSGVLNEGEEVVGGLPVSKQEM